MPLLIAPVAPWIACSDGLAYAGASGTMTGNNVYLMAFEVYGAATVTSLGYRMGVTVTGTTDCGIYDVNGNQLAHTGAITNVASTTQKNALGTPLVLTPGLYLMGLTASNSTDTYIRISSTAGASLSRERQAVNTAAAGVLPNTTGGMSSGATIPAMIVIFSGGLA